MPTTDASTHFDRGTTFYSEGDYGAALIEFKRAYDLSPHWQVLFNIGQSYFQLRDYANAFVTLQRFANEGGERIDRDDRATLDTELPDLANRVARVTVSSNLAGATVSVDDQVVGVTPLREPALVGAGSHRIAAAYAGRPAVEERVAVGGRDALTVRLEFPELAPPPAPPKHELPPTERPAPRSPSYVPAYLTLIAAGGGMVVGSIFGVMALQEKSSLDRVCTSSAACPMSAQTDINALSRDGTISTVGFGVGLASAAVSVVLWLVLRPSSTDEPSSRSGATTGVEPGRGLLAGSF